MGSMFYSEESIDALKMKLLHGKLKLTCAKNFASQLVQLLNHVSQDMDTIELQLHSLLQPHSTIITDSSCLSHMDPSVSSSEFPNIAMGFLDEQQPWTPRPGSMHPKVDPASVRFQSLVEGKMLPEKGNLVQAVMEAGPLLQNLLDAGQLPTWRHPPPSEPINVCGFADPEGVSWSNTLRFTRNASVEGRPTKQQRIY